MSWIPFSGGKRVCFGKTFAESVNKLALTMMAQRFDIEFTEKGKYSASDMPRLLVGQSHFPPLKVKLTSRKN